MAGQFGLPLAAAPRSQYVTIGAASSQSAGLNPLTSVISLYSNIKCWIAIGSNPTAVKPSAEKTAVESFPLQAEQVLDVVIPIGTDAANIKVAVIQDTAAGQLDIIERRI